MALELPIVVFIIEASLQIIVELQLAFFLI